MREMFARAKWSSCMTKFSQRQRYFPIHFYRISNHFTETMLPLSPIVGVRPRTVRRPRAAAYARQGRHVTPPPSTSHMMTASGASSLASAVEPGLNAESRRARRRCDRNSGSSCSSKRRCGQKASENRRNSNERANSMPGLNVILGRAALHENFSSSPQLPDSIAVRTSSSATEFAPGQSTPRGESCGDPRGFLDNEASPQRRKPSAGLCARVSCCRRRIRTPGDDEQKQSRRQHARLLQIFGLMRSYSYAKTRTRDLLRTSTSWRSSRTALFVWQMLLSFPPVIITAAEISGDLGDRPPGTESSRRQLEPSASDVGARLPRQLITSNTQQSLAPPATPPASSAASASVSTQDVPTRTEVASTHTDKHGTTWETVYLRPGSSPSGGPPSAPAAETGPVGGSRREGGEEERTRSLQGSNSEQAARVWVIRNSVAMSEGWRVAEFAFYEDEGCTRPLEHQTLRHGPITTMAATAPPRASTAACSFTGNHGPEKATDGFENTFWISPCCPCGILEAHVGADFGSPVVVMCARVVQAQAPYAASSITLSKEGTTIGVAGNLWVDLATWTDLGPGANIEVSGINSGPTSITYEVQGAQQCYGYVFGQEYEDLQYAKNACVSNPSCGAVYEQACQNLEYEVTITNANDLETFSTALVTVTIPPARPGDEIISNTFIQTSAVIGDTVLLKDSTNVNPVPKAPVAASLYPFKILMSVKPKYGAIRTCVRGYVPTPSPEGSCLHVKKGSLLEFSVYSNYAAGEQYVISATYTSSAADCATLCLQTSTCNAFAYTIRENGNPPTLISCKLLQMPPKEQFTPPMGLIPKDGVLDVVDFYQREHFTNATLGDSTEETDTQSGAFGAPSPNSLVLFFSAGLSALLLAGTISAGILV